MARLGYECDDCVETWRNREPAAAWPLSGGDYLDLCPSCYDERVEQREAA